MRAFSPAWWAARATVPPAGRVRPAIARRYVRWMGPLLRALYRPSLHGLEHLPQGPDARPVLIVANHSGGIAAAELSSLALLYFERLPDTRIAALAHPLSFNVWPITKIMAWAGAQPSTYEAAAAALADSAHVLVFPGGDYEAGRPFWLADRVDFGGRQGFLRIARRAGVDIVPLGISGSHLTAPVLWRSDRFLAWLYVLPRLLGVKRYPLTLLAVLGAVAIAGLAGPALGPGGTLLALWAWLASPFTLLPVLPGRIRFRFGPARSAEDLFGERPEPDLGRAYDAVVAAVQAEVRGRGDPR